MAEMIIDKTTAESQLGVPCLICGEIVKLSYREETDVVYRGVTLIKVCDKCKNAVMRMRERKEQK